MVCEVYYTHLLLHSASKFMQILFMLPQSKLLQCTILLHGEGSKIRKVSLCTMDGMVVVMVVASAKTDQ